MTELATTKSIITELVKNPQFGDSPLLLNRGLINTGSLLAELHQPVPNIKAFSSVLAAAGRKLQALILTDPIVRKKIEEAVLVSRHSDPEADKFYQRLNEFCLVLTEWLPELTQNPVYTPFQKFGVGCDWDKTLGEPPGHLVFWYPQQSGSPLNFAGHFEELFNKYLATALGSMEALLKPPSVTTKDIVTQGLNLLDLIAPQFAGEVSTFGRIVALVDLAGSPRAEEVPEDFFNSATINAIPGSIFLSPKPLRHPIYTAECLFHEALHLKLDSLITADTIYLFDKVADAPTIRAVWRNNRSWNSYNWPVERAFAALHVYVHLYVYYICFGEIEADIQARYGFPPDFDRVKITAAAGFRAHYLLGEIVKIQNTFLGETGKQMLVWFEMILEAADKLFPQGIPDQAQTR